MMTYQEFETLKPYIIRPSCNVFYWFEDESIEIVGVTSTELVLNADYWNPMDYADVNINNIDVYQKIQDWSEQ